MLIDTTSAAVPAHTVVSQKPNDAFCMHRCLAAIHNYPQCLQRCKKEEATRAEVLPTGYVWRPDTRVFLIPGFRSHKQASIGEHTHHVFRRVVSAPSLRQTERNQAIRNMLFRPKFLSGIRPIMMHMMDQSKMLKWRRQQMFRRQMESAASRREAFLRHRVMLESKMLRASHAHEAAEEHKVHQLTEELAAKERMTEGAFVASPMCVMWLTSGASQRSASTCRSSFARRRPRSASSRRRRARRRPSASASPRWPTRCDRSGFFSLRSFLLTHSASPDGRV